MPRLGDPSGRRQRRVAALRRHLCAADSSGFEAKKAMFDQENPIPFAGFVEANSQHIGGIGVLEGRAPNDIHLQYLERMAELGLEIPAEYTVRSYHTEQVIAANRPILDWAKVMEQLCMESFLRDGVLVLKGVFTRDATARLRASCEHVQQQNDRWLEHDWHEPTQWARIGLKPPTAPRLTEEEKEAARGGCQLLNGSGLGEIFRSVEANNPAAVARGTHFGSGVLRDTRSIRWPKGLGIFPEHCPILHDDWLLEAMTHPQMIALHQALLGSAEVRFDHNTLLSRRAFIGQHWHSHNYVEDNCGPTTTPGGARLRLCRSLLYPDGFRAHNDGAIPPACALLMFDALCRCGRVLRCSGGALDLSCIAPDHMAGVALTAGGLKVVPGAHLYRSRDLKDSEAPCVLRPRNQFSTKSTELESRRSFLN